MKATNIAIRLLSLHILAATISALAKSEKGYVAANGVNYYYEIHGKGEPLLLLHGGLGSIELFEPDLNALAQNRTVIAVELHGHGRTALGERPIRYVDMGDDMAVILKQLIYGDSDMFRLEHVVQFYHLLGGGLRDAGWQREHISQNRLAILPDLTHYEMAMSPKLVETALPFLNAAPTLRNNNKQEN